MKKRLTEIEATSLKQHPELLSQVMAVQAAIEKVEKGDHVEPGGISGLESAGTGLGAALRVVESSDRTIPSQAMELYRQADEVAKAQLAQWTDLKTTQLSKLNEALVKAGVAPIQLSEIEREMEDVATQ